MPVLHVKAIELELLGLKFVGVEDKHRPGQRGPGGRGCARDDVGQVLLALLFLGLVYFRFNQVVGVREVGEVGFGRASSGILLRHHRAGAYQQSNGQPARDPEAEIRNHQYDSTSGARTSTLCKRASMPASVLSNWLCSTGLCSTYRPSPRKCVERSWLNASASSVKAPTRPRTRSKNSTQLNPRSSVEQNTTSNRIRCTRSSPSSELRTGTTRYRRAASHSTRRRSTNSSGSIRRAVHRRAARVASAGGGAFTVSGGTPGSSIS